MTYIDCKFQAADEICSKLGVSSYDEALKLLETGDFAPPEVHDA